MDQHRGGRRDADLPSLVDWLGLIPQYVIVRHWIWQPVTYMFLHDVHNLTHILFNMLGLWMFGVELEQQWGTRFFVKYYVDYGHRRRTDDDTRLAPAVRMRRARSITRTQSARRVRSTVCCWPSRCTTRIARS